MLRLNSETKGLNIDRFNANQNYLNIKVDVLPDNKSNFCEFGSTINMYILIASIVVAVKDVIVTTYFDEFFDVISAVNDSMFPISNE